MVKFNEELRKYTSLRVGGAARYLVIPKDRSDLQEALAFARERGLPWVVLGNGTNILFPDEGYPGVVLKLGPGLRGKELREGGGGLHLGAGEGLGQVLRYLHRHGLHDLDFLVGIPGTVGGAIAMNAGIPEASIGDFVERVWALDPQGRLHSLSREECGFGYRDSRFRHEPWVIVAAEFRLGGAWDWDLEELLARRRRQPGLPSPGCVFKNPPGESAGRLIDRAGLKGFRVGGAAISPVHANFIVNLGGARASDVLKLMEIVRERVRATFGVDLEPELELVFN